MPNDIDTIDLHVELLELLTIVDDFCRSHNIRYSLHGGTMLGAIREGGFIPWDADADISFVRREFISFEKAIKEEPIQFVEYEDSLSSPTARLRLQREGKPRVCLDVFVYDYISGNKLARKIKMGFLAFYLIICKNKELLEVTKKGQYKGFKANFAVFLNWLFRPIPLEKKIKHVEWYRQRFKGKMTFVHRSNDQYKGMKIVLPSEFVEDYVYVEFEGKMLQVHGHYLDILESSYGKDFMIPKKDTDSEREAHRIIRKL